ncbi:hypothetical protein [Kitasatospora phosalacinea]|uniref:Uncharacterized protein n=1 Tax=Kitasatospora phosalacinea TaxID=2065 RepID=A0A9W6PFG5_9ACTN|nr:hypothetical protein [Kitasatospora phosalacinea]GLW53947.1 hypothetical protein Kpho01_19580 [Kitasatospora phosalacinea]
MNTHQQAPGRGLHLAAAVAAVDVEDVRRAWRAAQAAGEPRWYLDLIARVGRRRAGGELSRAVA